MEIEILYEDNHIIAVNKKIGDIVQGDEKCSTPRRGKAGVNCIGQCHGTDMAGDFPQIGDDDGMRGLHGIPSDMVVMGESAAIADSATCAKFRKAVSESSQSASL